MPFHKIVAAWYRKFLHAVRGIYLRHVQRKMRFKLTNGLLIYRGLQSRGKSPPDGTERDIRSLTHEFIGYFFLLSLDSSLRARIFSPVALSPL